MPGEPEGPAARPYLSNTRATREETRSAAIAVAIGVALVAALTPFAKVQLAPQWAFIPTYQSALVISDLVTAVLLASQFYYLRSSSLLVLAAGYFFSACMAFVHMLTFPGLFAPGGGLGAGPQTTAWLYMFWHAGFPAAVIAYSILERRGSALRRPFGAAAFVALAAGIVLAVAAALTAWSTAGQASLPDIMRGNRYTPIMIAVVGSVWLTSVAALAVLWRKRPHSLLDVWLMVVMCAWVFDIALAAVLNAGRFDVGFYAGRIFGLVASVLVLLVLLVENGRLYAQLLRRREVEAAEREKLVALNRELDAARETALEADRTKSAFLATISHEIRTPLNGMIGLLELLSLGYLPSAQRSQVATIRESSQSLLRIIDDLLDMSKIEAGRLELAPETASIKEVVASVSAAYAGMASAKNLLLEEACDPGISRWVTVDHVRLRQILNNLVSNAIKFTDRGKVSLSARLVGREQGCDIVRFTVSDTGIGISKENQAKLFQPFVQAEASTTRRFGGTGLGLSICQRLAQAMGGSIELRSEEGAGTTMTVTLRFGIVADERAPARPGDVQPGQPATPIFRACPTVEEAEREGTLVLVADDHPVNRMVLQRQLARIGYASECVENGREMLERWRSGRFALLLADCHMPDMDGYEATVALRGEERASGARPVTIVACTASAMEGDAGKCIAAGMNDYLSKPIQLGALAAMMKKWLPWEGRLSPDAVTGAATPTPAGPAEPRT